MRAPKVLLAIATTIGLAWPVLAAPPGHDEGYVPVVSHGPGAHGSTWSTDVWIYRQGATLVHLWYNPSGFDNSGSGSVVVPLADAVTVLPDIVAATFHAAGKGSLHYLADGPVVVVTKTWTPGPTGGTYGQFIDGQPLSAASTPDTGQAGSLRMVIDKAAGFRANLGIANVSGNPLSVTVEAFAPDGTPEAGTVPFTVTLKPFDMTQVDDVLARLSTTAQAGVILRASVTSGSGGIIGYLSEVDNTTNSGAYQEAFRFGY